MNNCHQCGFALGPHCGQNCPKCRCQLRPSPCGCKGDCKCGHTPTLPRASVQMCDGCDPCQPCESMVRICTQIVPNLEQGRFFRNSFIYNQEDESVYYISDKGDELPFGSRPLFINNFDPTSRVLKQQLVIDNANGEMYSFDMEGNYVQFTVDTSGKLSMVTTPGEKRAYTIEPDGSQSVTNIIEKAEQYSIPIRDERGAILVGSPANPEHATTKQYVDDAISNLPVSKPSLPAPDWEKATQVLSSDGDYSVYEDGYVQSNSTVDHPASGSAIFKLSINSQPAVFRDHAGLDANALYTFIDAPIPVKTGDKVSTLSDGDVTTNTLWFMPVRY